MRRLFNRNLVIALLVGAVIYLLFRGSIINTPKIVVVKNADLVNRVVDKTISAGGTVIADYEADLSFPITQKVVDVKVKEGDTVLKGELLAYLDTSQLSQTAQSYKDLRDIALRKKELFERDKQKNIDALGGTDQYNIRLRQYEEEISQAEATYRAGLATLNNAYLYAPFDGTIVSVNKKAGEVATAGQSIIKIADLNTLKFEINIDQEDYGLLVVDLPADINLDSFGNTKIPAKVDTIPPYVSDTATNTFSVELVLTDTGGVTPVLGMTGDARVKIATTEVEVPSLFYDEIYFDEEDSPYVWINENGYVSKLPVEIGLEGDLYTEIKSDLTNVEIIKGLTTDTDIKDGYKVRVAK